MSSQRARGALAVSVLVFFVIAYQHGSLPARSGDGPEQAREAIRAGARAGPGAGGAGGGAELGVKPDVRAAGDVRPGRGARAALGGGAELGAEPGVRAAGVARWGRGARAALGGGGGGMRRSTGAQRRAQNKEALAVLSQRMCGSPAADMCAHRLGSASLPSRLQRTPSRARAPSRAPCPTLSRPKGCSYY